MTTGVRAVCLGVGGLALSAVLASCSVAAAKPGTAETDRIVETVATAISDPRQDTPDGVVRAALATRAGEDGRLAVVELEELDADGLSDPFVRLVFRIFVEASGSGISDSDAVTACYEAQFSYYGAIDRPSRVDCRAGATAIVPGPLAPQPRVAIPADFDGPLAELLGALPAAPSAEGVSERVTGGLPAPGVDPNTGLQNVAPGVQASVSGADVGVALWEPDTRNCLLGARIGGQVSVWRPSRIQMQPGELSCDPQTALHLAGLGQPH